MIISSNIHIMHRFPIITYYIVENYNKKGDFMGNYRNNRMHMHKHNYTGSTSVNDNHLHNYSGTTSQAIEYYESHYHEYEGWTTTNDGHRHYYEGRTGPAIRTAGGHIHMMEGRTTMVDNHIHYYENDTGRALRAGHDNEWDNNRNRNNY